MDRASVSEAVDLGFSSEPDQTNDFTLVIQSFLIEFQHYKNGVENMLASSLVTSEKRLMELNSILNSKKVACNY